MTNEKKTIKAPKYKVTNITTKKEDLVKSFANIDAKLAGSKQYVHNVCYSALKHYNDHGDYTIAQTLIDNVKEKSVRNKIITYFIEYSKVNYNADTQSFYHVPKKSFDLESAFHKPYHIQKGFNTKERIEKTPEEQVKALADRLLKSDDGKIVAKHLLALYAQLTNAPSIDTMAPRVERRQQQAA